MRISENLLTEILSFFDRKFLETVIRLVSRKFGVILNNYFAEIPYYVIDEITVNLRRREFLVNETNIYANVVRETFADAPQIAFDGTQITLERQAVRLEPHHFERAALPGGAFLPRYLRVLRTYFHIMGECYDYTNEDEIFKDIITTFSPTWSNYAAGHVAFFFCHLGANSAHELMKMVTVPALTLQRWDVELIGTGLNSIFDHPTVRDCARLEIRYMGRAQHLAIDALASSGIVAWLHSEPKMSSSHALARPFSDALLLHILGGSERQSNRRAKEARRELQINCPFLEVDFDYLRPLVKTVATSFVNDTVRREFKIEFNFEQLLPNAQNRPPPSELVNARTRERLRLEWREYEHHFLYRNALHVTRRPLDEKSAV